MTATLTDVAQAVTNELNAQSWSIALTAERYHLVKYALPDLVDIKVPVVGRGIDKEQFTRSETVDVLEVDVGILVKLDDLENLTLDPYVALVDEIANHFQAVRLPSLEQAISTVSRPDPIYDQDVLETERVFQSVLRLEFRYYP